MIGLYRRLSDCGFDPKFIRETVLPDWWQDSLASVPANRSMAEMALARHLGFRVADLRDPAAPLTPPPAANFRLKCNKVTQPEEVRAAVIVAQRATDLVLGAIGQLAPFAGCSDTIEMRKQVLRDRKYVDLTGLVQFCWNMGIIVLYIDPKRMPKSTKKFQGLAMFRDGRPVIVLGYGCDSPPWLAFHLAHELGHICRAHVRVGDEPLVDSEITRAGDDQQDQQADEFATEILTGEKQLKLTSNRELDGPSLADAVKSYGDHNAVAPGTAALIYARCRDRWGVGQRALNLLGEDHGAKDTLYGALRQHLKPEDLPESAQRFLGCLTPVTS